MRSLGRSGLVIALCGSVWGLSGCSVLQDLGKAGNAADYTGNYAFAQAPGTAGRTSGPVLGFVGAVANSANSFTATLRPVTATGCASSTQNLSFTGTRDGSGQITLLSTSLSTNPITITWLDDPSQSSNGVGTYTIAGNGPCAMAATEFVSDQFSPVTGTYVGTFVSAAGVQATVTAALAQGPANGDGQFPESGTLVLTTATCSNNFTVSGMVTGPTATVQFNPSGNASLGGFAAALPDHVLTVPLPSGITVTGACNPGVFTGVLSKQ